MNILLQTGDKIKFEYRDSQQGSSGEGYVQISRDGTGVHTIVNGELVIIPLGDVIVKAVKRKGQGEWLT